MVNKIVHHYTSEIVDETTHGSGMLLSFDISILSDHWDEPFIYEPMTYQTTTMMAK